MKKQKKYTFLLEPRNGPIYLGHEGQNSKVIEGVILAKNVISEGMPKIESYDKITDCLII